MQIIIIINQLVFIYLLLEESEEERIFFTHLRESVDSVDNCYNILIIYFKQNYQKLVNFVQTNVFNYINRIILIMLFQQLQLFMNNYYS